MSRDDPGKLIFRTSRQPLYILVALKAETEAVERLPAVCTRSL